MQDSHSYNASCKGDESQTASSHEIPLLDRRWTGRGQSESGGHVGTFFKLIAGAMHHGLYCFEPQTTVRVLTVPLKQDIRGLGILKGNEKSLTVSNTILCRCGSRQLCN